MSRDRSRGVDSYNHHIVLNALHDAGGLTDEELIEVTGMRPNTCRPRRIDLCKAGIVRKSGQYRNTRASGTPANVWVPVFPRAQEGEAAHA